MVDTTSHRRHRWARYEFAAAVLLVVSLIGFSFQWRQPDTTNQLAFMDQTKPDTVINTGGDPGRSGVLGTEDPILGNPAIAFSWADDVDDPWPMSVPLIVGDGLFVSFQDIWSKNGGVLVKFDLRTGSEVWNKPIRLEGVLASDGKQLFGFSYTNRTDDVDADLVAIDLESGSIVWTGPSLFARDGIRNAVVFENGVVYGVDFLNNMVAVDAATGERIWQNPVEIQAPPEYTNSYGAGVYPSAQIVLSRDTVFSITPGMSIVAVDRETGKEVARSNLVTEVSEGVIFARLQVSGDRLVVTAIQPEHSPIERESRGASLTTIIEFVGRTLTPVYKVDLPDLRGFGVVTEDTIFQPTSFVGDGPAMIYPIDRATGKIGEPIPGVQDVWDIALSASGSTLIAITGFDVSCIDMNTLTVRGRMHIQAENTETFTRDPALMWGQSPVIISEMGEVVIIEPGSGATPPAATPAA